MMRYLFILLLTIISASATAQTVSTAAGSAGASGLTNGNGSLARFNSPHGIASDKNGNIYIADRLNHVIRKIKNGQVTTFAGSGTPGAVDATGTAASFFEPHGIACDTAGNVYVADTRNFKIRMITPAGIVTTIAGEGVFGTTNGPAASARFGFPVGIAVTPDGSTIYVSDYNTHVIRKITGGSVSTTAGLIYVSGNTNGFGSGATFDHPAGLCLDNNGNVLIADEWNNQIRSMTPTGTVSTIAGSGVTGSNNGSALTASFNWPTGISKGPGTTFIISDALNHTLRSYDPATQQISTYAGLSGSSGSTDGQAASARFNNPTSTTYSTSDYALYCSDQLNHTVRKIVSLSSIQLTLTAVSATVCSGDSIAFTISPAGLSNYTLLYNGNIVATAGTGNIITAPMSAGTYSFTCSAIDGNGGFATGGSTIVTVSPIYTPGIYASNTEVCPGDSVLITTDAGTNYVWSNGSTTSSIYVKTPGSYSATLTNAQGCRGTSPSVNITQLPTTPVVITPSTASVCPGATISLSVTNGNAYVWSTGAVTQEIFAGAGIHTVTVTQSNGCKVAASVTIATHTVTPPVINPSTTQQLFPGDSILFGATGGTSYLWSNGATTASVYISQTGTYLVTATDNNGCTSTSQPVQVIPFNTSTMVQVVGATSFCESDTTYLQSAFANGNQWFYNSQPIVGATSSILNPDQSGYYKVRVNIGGNLVFSDSIQITIWPSPANPQLQDQLICSGSSAVIPATNTGNAVINWYETDMGGSPLFTGNPFVTPALTVLTEYYAEAVSPEGCSTGGRELVTIDLLPAATASFTYSSNYQQGAWNVQFSNQSSGANSFQWTFGDTSTSTLSDPSHTYLQSNNYTVQLIAESMNGCHDTVLQVLELFNSSNLYVPTTFTPNGDGKNDIFRVRGERIQVEEMRIFNQWGTLIWQGNSSNSQWDGMAGGSTVTNGTYFYRIRITEYTGKESELTGTVTVIK